MTPQSHFMVVAPIDPNQDTALRQLLATMNYQPGVVNPQNNIIPFAQFDRLHFARFVTVRGGAYFFLPSIRALRYLASVGR